MKLVYKETGKEVPIGGDASVRILTGKMKDQFISLTRSEEPSDNYPEGRVIFNEVPGTLGWQQFLPSVIGAEFV